MSHLLRLLLTVCVAALVWLAPSRAEAARLPKEAGLCGADGTSLHVPALVQGCVPYEAPREAAGLCARAGQSRVVSTPIANAADEGSLTRADAPCGPQAAAVRAGTVSRDSHTPSAPEAHAEADAQGWVSSFGPLLQDAGYKLLNAPRSPAAQVFLGRDSTASLERPPRS